MRIVRLLLLLSSTTFAQSTSCPIDLIKVDPHASPVSSAMLDITDKDPWDHYLRIEYRNQAEKPISAIKFGVVFVNALAEADRSVYDYTSDEIVKPGKIAKPYWGDGVYFHQYGWRMQAGAFVRKIMFADGTTWDGGISNPCVFPKSTNPVTPSELATNINNNSHAAATSPAAANAAAAFGHVLTKEELAQMVKDGKASVVAIITNPPGAEIFIDGNKAGISPLVFNLLKLPDQEERTITVKMIGYKTFEKKVTPDGKRIPLGIELEKDSR